MKGRCRRLRALAALVCALLLPGFAAAEGDARLVACEYAVYGGMENEDTTYALCQPDAWGDVTLTVTEHGRETKRALPWDALTDLADFMATYDPAGWAALPEREYHALDAPGRRIELTYDDGATYALYSDRDVDGPIFHDTECFLNSYLVEDAQTWEMSFSSFDGGGPEYRLVFSAPEKVWVSGRRVYDEPYDEMATGSGFTEIITVHGRIPGRTEMTIEVSGLTPLTDDPQPVYVLEVDDDYNVTMASGENGDGSR